eukprot:1191626-Prorocentrum_minimum.AAC.2
MAPRNIGGGVAGTLELEGVDGSGGVPVALFPRNLRRGQSQARPAGIPGAGLRARLPGRPRLEQCARGGQEPRVGRLLRGRNITHITNITREQRLGFRGREAVRASEVHDRVPMEEELPHAPARSARRLVSQRQARMPSCCVPCTRCAVEQGSVSAFPVHDGAQGGRTEG